MLKDEIKYPELNNREFWKLYRWALDNPAEAEKIINSLAPSETKRKDSVNAEAIVRTA